MRSCPLPAGMPMLIRRWSVALAALLAGAFASPSILTYDVLAQEKPAQENPSRERPARTEKPAPHSDDEQQSGPGLLRLLPPDAVNSKQITAGGRTIAYTATARTR